MVNRRFFFGGGDGASFLARLASFGGALAIAFATASAHAEAPDAGAEKKPAASKMAETTLRDQVMNELGRSQGNTPASVWRKFGQDVDLTVMDLANDAGLPLRLRVAAVRVLGELDTQVARSFLMRQLQSSKTTGAAGTVVPGAPEVRDALSMMRAAVLALGWTRSEEAIPAIERLLYHTEPEVRLDAIAALVLSRRPQGLAALEFARQKEKDKAMRKKLDKQIDRLREALKGDPALRAKPLPPPRISEPPPIQQRFDPNRPEQRL
jgi:HEAT repeats